MTLKGYDTYSGYMGWTGEEYRLFSCEADYRDYIEEAELEDCILDNFPVET